VYCRACPIDTHAFEVDVCGNAGVHRQNSICQNMAGRQAPQQKILELWRLQSGQLRIFEKFLLGIKGQVKWMYLASQKA